MIVVVGVPSWRSAAPPGPAGRAASIAIAAAAAGARVELVGRAGDDDAGDRLLLALAQAGVGHVAVLRDPARPTPIDTSPSAVVEPSLDLAVDQPGPGEDEDAHPDPGPGPVLDAADVALGLRYLTEFAVLVLGDDVPAVAVPAAAEAATYASAHLVVLVAPGARVPEGLPSTATALAAPGSDPDGAFARLVGTYAAALDRGEDPAAAFRHAAAGAGWEGVTA
jgi:ribokinase